MPGPRRQRRRRPEAPPLAGARRRFAELTSGEWIAAIAAILLFVFTFFDWYGYEQRGNLLFLIDLFGFPANAWDKLGVIPWILVTAVVAAIGMAALRIVGSKRESAIPPSAIVTVLGGLAVLLVGYRIIDPPGIPEVSGASLRITVEYGAYLSLAAAAGISIGGYRAMGERGTSFAKVADELASEQPRPRKGAPKRSPRREPRALRKQSRSSSD